MKKAFLFLSLATLLLSAVKVNAQVGFHVGYAPQFLSVTNKNADGAVVDPGVFHGFFGGIRLDYDLVDNLDIVTSLQIRMNSANSKSVNNGTPYDTQDWQFIADLPILLSYAFDLGHDVNLGLCVGPMLSYGISYMHKERDAQTHAIVNSINRYSTKLADPSWCLKRFELGAAGGLFVEYKGFVFFGGYRMAFNDLDRMSEQATRAHGFFVGVGVN